MVGLYKDPKGEDIFSRVTGSELTSMHQIGLRRAGNANDEALKKKISDLEAELRDARVCCMAMYAFFPVNYVHNTTSKIFLYKLWKFIYVMYYNFWVNYKRPIFD